MKLEKLLHRNSFNIPIGQLKLARAQKVEIKQSLFDVVSLMFSSKIGSCVIFDKGIIAGIFTERDLLMRVGLNYGKSWEEAGRKTIIEEVMTPGPMTLTMDHTLAQAMKLMVAGNFRHLPITSGEQKKEEFSMLSIRDILTFIIEFFPQELEKAGTLFGWHQEDNFVADENFYQTDSELGLNGKIFHSPLQTLLFKNPVLVDQSLSTSETIKVMRELKVASLLLVEYDTTLKGIFTERDFLNKIWGEKIQGRDPLEQEVEIKKIMTPSPQALLDKHLVAHAINNMFVGGHRNIPILDKELYPIGIVNLQDIVTTFCYQIFGNLREVEEIL